MVKWRRYTVRTMYRPRVWSTVRSGFPGRKGCRCARTWTLMSEAKTESLTALRATNTATSSRRCEVSAPRNPRSGNQRRHHGEGQFSFTLDGRKTDVQAVKMTRLSCHRFRSNKDGGWEYTDSAGESKMEIPGQIGNVC